ncbi:hypothetical protein HYR69_04750 [Candidatus Sumerlaeota bacterium]|nr:hypothetical protein [Candidatus Sumerlaeota bacterium]
MQTENAGLRALLIRELGYRQIMEELGSALIDTASRDLPAPPPLPEPILTKLPALANFKHQSKCSMELRRIEVLSDEPIQLLKVECPSTGAAYILRVPPEMTRCEQARAWTMGDEEVTFNAES